MPVYIFLLQGIADGTSERLSAGTRRTLLVFLKQDENDTSTPNYVLCESVIRKCGWKLSEFQGATAATPQALKAIQRKPEPAVERAYGDAYSQGFGVLVFAD